MKRTGKREEYFISINSRNPDCGLEMMSEEESKQGKCSPAQTYLSGYSLSRTEPRLRSKLLCLLRFQKCE